MWLFCDPCMKNKFISCETLKQNNFTIFQTSHTSPSVSKWSKAFTMASLYFNISSSKALYCFLMRSSVKHFCMILSSGCNAFLGVYHTLPFLVHYLSLTEVLLFRYNDVQNGRGYLPTFIKFYCQIRLEWRQPEGGRGMRFGIYWTPIIYSKILTGSIKNCQREYRYCI